MACRPNLLGTACGGIEMNGRMVEVSIDMFLDAPNFGERVEELISAFKTTNIYIDRKNLLDCEKEFLDEELKKRCDNCPFWKRGLIDDSCRQHYGNVLFCFKRATWRNAL